MKRRFKIIILFTYICMLFYNRVYSYEKLSSEVNKGILTMTYDVKESEENEFLELIKKNIQNENKEYEFIKFDKFEDEQNLKKITKSIIKKDLLDDDEDSIRNIVDENIEYSEDGYSGILDIVSIDTNIIKNGTHKEIEEIEIPFAKVNINDLNNINKEIVMNGRIYYLTNVDWQEETIEEIDGSLIPKSYMGIEHYQTIIEKENPYTYEATINYTGTTSLSDKLYHYTVTYKEVEKEEIVEEKTNYSIPVIIVSAIGIVLVMILIITKKRKKEKTRR